MKRSIKQIVQSWILILPILMIPMVLPAQDMMTDEYEKAKKEMKEAFGTVPLFFEVWPKSALPGAWEEFKAIQSEDAAIPPKYRQLIELAVASQIPCNYCIYFHAAAAKAFGATDQEVKEAIANGAMTRKWSMVLQGNQVDLEEFKMQADKIMEYMAAQSKK